MKVVKRIFIIGVVLFAVMGCGKQQTVDTYAEYLTWLSDEGNGLVKSKQAGGITLKVKQLPSNYLAYQRLSDETNITKSVADSLIKRISKSLTFLMTIGIEEGAKGKDIMFKGIRDYKSYKERFLTMNFEIDEYVTLKANGKTYRPVLSSLENVYGLTDSRNITIVFVPETEDDEQFYSSEELTFTYDDELFATGINHFKFKREDINNAPHYIFWK